MSRETEEHRLAIRRGDISQQWDREYWSRVVDRIYQVERIEEGILTDWPKECGPGWRPMIELLVELCRIRSLTILQVKEKFGRLRFYVSASADGRTAAPPDVIELLDAAEMISGTVCEACGAPGEVRDGPWFKTLCHRCLREPE